MSASHCKTLIDSLIFRAQTQPEEPLYSFLNGRGQITQTLTYGSLLTAVQQMGRWLTERTALGDRIAIQLPTSPEFMITFFACLYTARIPVPLSLPNRKYQGDYYQKIFADCSARLAIIDPTICKTLQTGKIPQDTSLVSVPTFSTETSESLSPSCKARYDIAFLQYTSGSTSFPKGVKVSHTNIMANQRMIESAFGHDRDSVGLAWVPLFHDMGLIGSVIQPLYVGFPCYFMTPMTFVKRPKLWLDLIWEKRITTTGGPNFAYDLCVKRVKPEELAEDALASWQVAYNGAEQIQARSLKEFARTFGDRGFQSTAFLPCYGLAEATLIVSGVDKSLPPQTLSIAADALSKGAPVLTSHQNRTVVSSGHVMPGLTLKIIDPHTLQERLPHQVGEVWVAGESITAGYWQKPKKTAETFVTHRGVRFLRTGDLGFLTADRELYITGRLKDLIIIEGRNYYPQDFEETAQQAHSALQNSRAAVFAIAGNSVPRLVVVCELDRAYSRETEHTLITIQSQVAAAIYQQFQLKVQDVRLVPSNSIPKTTSGKIQRQRTKLLYLVDQLPKLPGVTSPDSRHLAAIA